MRRKRMAFVVVVAGLAWVGLATSGDPIPVGGTFPISTNGGFNLSPSVAIDPAAGFVVTWGTYGGELGSTGVKRRYSSLGDALEAPEPSAGFAADVVIAPNGEHTLLSSNLSLRRYASDGSILGESNVATGQSPAMARAQNGDLVLVWTAVPSPTSRQIRGLRLASDLTPLSAEIEISAVQADLQAPRIDVDSAGDFVVTWLVDSNNVMARRFSADGTAKDPSFQVPTYTTGASTEPDVAMQPDGGFLVVWTSDGSLGTDTHEKSIAGRRYAADGLAIGDQFQINSYTFDRQTRPAVAGDAQGKFIVVWHSVSQISGQRLGALGMPVGGEFEIANTSFKRSAVDAEPDGDFVVVWEDYASYGIRGRQFRANALFGDGFELGNTSSWFGTTP